MTIAKGFKLRDLAHTGEEATIPSNLRAIERPKKGKSSQGIRHKMVSYAENKEKILEYLDTYGAIKDVKKLSVYLGYTKLNTAYGITNRMEKENLIRRVGVGHYILKQRRDDLGKGDDKNGAVYSAHLDLVSSYHRPTEPTGPTELEDTKPDATREDTMKSEHDATLFDIFDGLLWRYVKERMGDEEAGVHAAFQIIKLSEWLKEVMKG